MNPIAHLNPLKKSLPGRIEGLLRVGGTVRLVNSLMRDARVPAMRKVCFSAMLASLLAAMIFPELVADGFMATIMPFISSIIGVPIEAGVDWFTFVMLLPVLLRIFPADIMQEHYLRVFKNKQPLLTVPAAFEAKVVPNAGRASS